MYYRYEAQNRDGQYVGIFQVFNPSERRYFNRFLRAPKWYENNPDVDSRCWFTDHGYKKYHKVIDDIIKWNGRLETRLIVSDKLDNLAMNGKTQCIELIKR